MPRITLFLLAGLLAGPLTVQAGDVPHQKGPGCDKPCEGHVVKCPQCDAHCEWSVSKDAETRHCWQVECTPVCIPKVRFPWEKCCTPKCAKVIYVHQLKKAEYTCETCNYKWTAVCDKGACLEKAGPSGLPTDGPGVNPESDVPPPPPISAQRGTPQPQTPQAEIPRSPVRPVSTGLRSIFDPIR